MSRSSQKSVPNTRGSVWWHFVLTGTSSTLAKSCSTPISCKHGYQVGHSTRGCKVLAAERNPQELSEDDVAFWSYVKPDQRSANVAGVSENNYLDEENEKTDSKEDMMEID